MAHYRLKHQSSKRIDKRHPRSEELSRKARRNAERAKDAARELQEKEYVGSSILTDSQQPEAQE